MDKPVVQTSKSAAQATVKGPKALFWFLTLFFSLGITAFSTGGLWFQFINKWLPQEINYGQVISSFNQSALKWEMASLIVAVPLFFVLSYLIRQALKKTDLLPDNKVRLWITYIILFIVIATAAGDLISTTFALLNGDFTTRFLLKALVILVITIWIFVYYWLEIRSLAALTSSIIPRIFGYVSLIVVIGSFIGTFFIIDSPQISRQKAFDQTRVSDLQEIKYTIDSYYAEYGKLPDSLTELLTNNAYLKIADPKTNQKYVYEITGTEAYQLCADFENTNKDAASAYYNYPVYDQYIHDSGHTCFDRQVAKNGINTKPSIPVPTNPEKTGPTAITP